MGSRASRRNRTTLNCWPKYQLDEIRNSRHTLDAATLAETFP